MKNTPTAPVAARAAQAADAGALRPVRVWDLPTRLFHWTLAGAFVGLVISGNVGGGAMVWHMRLGLLVLALLVFRLVWGLIGGHWSRFASFVRGPAAIARYLRGQPLPGERLDVGHNPLGALSVLAMLAFLAVQVATGLVADDEIATTGPLNRYVASATALSATAWHKGIGKSVLIVLVLLHVAAIVWYRVRQRTNLVAPMLHGDRLLPAGVAGSDDSLPRRLVAAVVVLACFALSGWIASLG